MLPRVSTNPSSDTFRTFLLSRGPPFRELPCTWFTIMEDQVCLSSTLHSSYFLSSIPLPFLQLVQLELLCHQLYESSDIATRRRAEKTLVAFSESPNSLPQCQILLENSQVHGLVLVYEYIVIPCSLHMHCYWQHQHSLN